jgi:hypothetical protein
LFGFPPQKRKGRGRPAIKGKPHKKLSAALKDPKVSWQRYRVSLWYGRTNRLVEITTGTALWYRSGVPPDAVRTSLYSWLVAGGFADRLRRLTVAKATRCAMA